MSAAIAARAATALGRFDLAREYATNAAAQADAAGNPSFAAMVRINGAATYLVVGDRDAALSDAYNSLRQVQVAGISGTVRGWFVDYALFVLSSLGVRDATTVLSQRDAEPPGSHAWMRHLSDAALALAENDYSRAFASSGLAVEECVRYRNLPDLYWAVAITVRSFVGAGRLREAVQLSGSLERELAEHGFDTRYLLESYEDAVNDCRAALDPRTFEELRSAGAAAPVIKLHKQLCDEASH